MSNWRTARRVSRRSLDGAGDEAAEGEYAGGEGENFQRADQAERVEGFHGQTEQREQGGQGEGPHGEVEGAQGADQQFGPLRRGAHFREVPFGFVGR